MVVRASTASATGVGVSPIGALVDVPVRGLPKRRYAIEIVAKVRWRRSDVVPAAEVVTPWIGRSAASVGGLYWRSRRSGSRRSGRNCSRRRRRYGSRRSCRNCSWDGCRHGGRGERSCGLSRRCVRRCRRCQIRARNGATCGECYRCDPAEEPANMPITLKHASSSNLPKRLECRWGCPCPARHLPLRRCRVDRVEVATSPRQGKSCLAPVKANEASNTRSGLTDTPELSVGCKVTAVTHRDPKARRTPNRVLPLAGA